MDFLVSAAVVVFGVLSYISFTFFLSAKPKPNGLQPDQTLLPGTTGWPIIGESLRLMSAFRNGKPETFFRERMNKYSAEVFKTSIAGTKLAILCGPGGNKLAFSSRNEMSGGWYPTAMKKIMLSKGSTLGAGNKLKMKDWLSQNLRPELLKDYVPIMDDMISKFMDAKLVTNQVFKAVSQFHELPFSLSCKIFMNIDDPSQVVSLHSLFDSLVPGFLAVPIDLPGTNFNRAIKSANRMREEISRIIKLQQRSYHESGKNQNHDNGNMFTYFGVSANTEDQVILNEIADTFLSVLVASHDTVISVISSVIYFLADHPDVYNQVLREQREIAKCKDAGELLNWNDLNKMKYSRNVMNEVLRLVPPGVMGFRQASGDITYAGFTIPKGCKILWSVHSTHKDPKYFENPEEFNPARFEGKGLVPYTFVPFGMGPHMCVGNEYARIEILIFIHNLVTRFRWEKMVPDEKYTCTPLPMPAKGLPIRLLPHDHH